jgi:hypothetical protein
MRCSAAQVSFDVGRGSSIQPFGGEMRIDLIRPLSSSTTKVLYVLAPVFEPTTKLKVMTH